MKKLSAILVAGVLSGVLPMAVSSVSAEDAAADANSAAQQEEASASPRVRRTQTLREVVYEKLEDARNLADEEQYSDALDVLARLEKRKRNSYERAMTHNMVAYVYTAQEKYDEAIIAYSQVLDIDNAPDSLKQTTLFTLAKLYMMQERYDESLNTLNSWMESSDKVGADAYLLRAQVQYQREAFGLAKDDVTTAVSMRKESGSKAPESWLLLQRAALFQLKDYAGLAANLESLVANYSKAEYWMQLAAVYNELGRSEQELATLETAYDMKLMTKEGEYLNFAQALLAREIPYKAAHVLEDGMQADIVEKSARNLSLLGDAWMMAREYDNAIVSMTAAASESGKGSDYFKLAQIYTERQEWNKAFDFSQKSLQVGDLKAPHQALIIKGLAQYNLNHLEEAATTFFQAARYPAAEKTAHQWQEYIESEQQRREYIAASEV
jgi:tetratricopeptide (TPR) repeat protein